MTHELAKEMLDLQESGIRLYANLSEFYHWLGEHRMSRILHMKLQEAVDNYLSTRFMLLDKNGYAKPREPPLYGDSKPKVTRLQWQEGTNEPEDEPNISNGEDILPKKPPTRQPWEMPIVGMSGKSAPKEDIDRLYNDGLNRWLAYEETAVKLYQELIAEDDWYEELMHESAKEVTCIKESLGAVR